jgi:sugar/nucleoside kinase (ribokinase family)
MTHVVCVGLATLDTVFEVQDHPARDSRVVASELTFGGGGPAATAAVTLARLDVETYFIGSVGDDETGTRIRAGLDDENVDTSELTVVPGARSPQSSILCDTRSSSRTIIHYPGTLPPLELSERGRELCLGAAWVHVDQTGYAPVRDLRHEIRLSIDGGNPIDDLRLDGVDLYAPTEPALRALSSTPEDAIAAGATTVIVTRGNEGSVALTSDGRRIEVPGLHIAPVSTLGAGDVFRGALLAQLMRNVPLADALTLANACAALSCRALDGRSAIPTAAELASTMP